MPGPQGPRDQFQGVGQLLGELLEPAFAPQHQPEQRQRSGQQAQQQHDGDVQTADTEARPSPTAANMPQIDEESRRRERRVGLLETRASNRGTWPKRPRQSLASHRAADASTLLSLSSVLCAPERSCRWSIGQPVFDALIRSAAEQKARRRRPAPATARKTAIEMIRGLMSAVDRRSEIGSRMAENRLLVDTV